MATTAELQTLRPESREAVMDLVAAAGIEVSGWAKKQDGSPVESPRANPQYCYEWSFGRGDEPRALCVWYDDLAVLDGRIVYRGNMKALADKLDLIARERWRPAQVKSRSRGQQKRAADFDFTLQRAMRRGEPLRVILLTGQAKKDMELGWDASKVDRRALDPMSWVVQSYSEDDGRFVLARSSALTTRGGYNSPPMPSASELGETVALDSASISAPASLLVIDQFDAPRVTREVASEVYVRSPEVRRRVLIRSGGICEWCGAPGFRMASGAVYLETHHVVPLCEGGADSTRNVLALCPNDHRRAHFAEESARLRESLLARLATLSAA